MFPSNNKMKEQQIIKIFLKSNKLLSLALKKITTIKERRYKIKWR